MTRLPDVPGTQGKHESLHGTAEVRESPQNDISAWLSVCLSSESSIPSQCTTLTSSDRQELVSQKQPADTRVLTFARASTLRSMSRRNYHETKLPTAEAI